MYLLYLKVKGKCISLYILLAGVVMVLYAVKIRSISFPKPSPVITPWNTTSLGSDPSSLAMPGDTIWEYWSIGELE